MRFVTFEGATGARPGIVQGDRILDLVAAAPLFSGVAAPATLTALIAAGAPMLESCAAVLDKAKPEHFVPLAGTRLLAPNPKPTKNIFCVGQNYKLHIEEGARARGRPVTFPAVPTYFSKPTTSVIGHDAEIRWDPKVTQQLDYEVELAIVIGKTCRDLTPQTAKDAIFGYTLVNDISARDLQLAHGQWFKGKGLDTFCPIGPWVMTADEFGDPSGHRITLRVNGETRQDSNTSDLLFDVTTLVVSLSAGLTLEAGDIIATGTPAGVALGMVPQLWLQDGDVVEAEVEGLGILRNTVRKV